MPLDLLMNFGDDAPPATGPFVETPRPGGDPRSIARAVEMLKQAERPMFIVGSQLRWSARRDVLREFADAVDGAYFLNGMARGGLPHAHPNFFARSRRVALGQTDLCFVFGTPFDFRLEYGRAINPGAKVIQIDLDGSEMGRNRKVDLAIHGDSGVVFEQILAEVKSKQAPAWVSTMRAAEEKSRAKMLSEIVSTSDPPNPLRVCDEIGKRLGKSDIVIGDGGDFVATAANVIKLEWPQIWMDPGPLGTLGVGPGYAMAAKLARPDARVVLIYGDGSFGFHALEFEAMVRQGIPVVSIIGNDAAWTQIRRGQVDLYGSERSVATSLDHTHYEKIVEAVGGVGYWVERIDDLGKALDAAFAADKPSCVNVKIARSDFRKGAISV